MHIIMMLYYPDRPYVNRPVARLFCGVGQIGQILGPFMIMRGLSCDRVGFGLFGGVRCMTPPPPPRLRACVNVA